MGNDMCCQDSTKDDTILMQNVRSARFPAADEAHKVQFPPVSDVVLKQLEAEQPFKHQIEAQALTNPPQAKALKNGVYNGPLKDGEPEGWGSLFRNDGSVFVGEFKKGIANGEGFFCAKNGATYKGACVDNKAQTNNGIYKQNDLVYIGGFKDNHFNWKGNETTNNSKFQGIYENGVKQEGVYEWEKLGEGSYKFSYAGKFNPKGEFEGQGTLKEPEGEYIGQFKGNKKNGKGKYTHKSKNGVVVVYEGDYADDHRSGLGKLTIDGKLEYEGQFKNGSPDGLGRIPGPNGATLNVKYTAGKCEPVL